ncbi:hypothetical protein F2Q69_00007515 [Brassica cretica]|uniref:Uncharacterized protein n=1 Tax=Brassica cretica TaxID=69181 RepID=A0A8S9PNX1_BRACR|nr:hypothetical protein F2Q69_00007515 [Brassica cretica]
MEALMASRACYIVAVKTRNQQEPKIVEVGFEVRTRNRQEPTTVEARDQQEPKTVEHGATLPWGGVSSRANHGSSEKKLFLTPRALRKKHEKSEKSPKKVARSLRSNRAQAKLGRHVATEHTPHSVATQRSSQARSLRSDQASVPLGRYVVLKPSSDAM